MYLCRIHKTYPELPHQILPPLMSSALLPDSKLIIISSHLHNVQVACFRQRVIQINSKLSDPKLQEIVSVWTKYI